MDVDGTLTDGKIYMGVKGEALKAFDIKDGYALHTLLKEHGILPVIITARKSPMVEHRCGELGVTEIHQGVMNKLDCLKGILEKYSSAGQQYDLSNVAYIGDDLLDLQCMTLIKEAGGIAGCPLDSVKEVISVCDYIAPHKGGEGAVRDFAGFLIDNYKTESRPVDDINKRCQEAVTFLSQLKKEDLTLGKHEVNDCFYYSVKEYETNGIKEKPFESHLKYVDIQLLVSGEELMQFADISKLQIAEAYNQINDCILYKPIDKSSGIILRPGSVLILYPNDGHRSMSLNNISSVVKKIVGKLALY